MELSLVAFAICGLFFAGIVKGATGIGYSSCALPFLVAAIGLKTAIVLLVAPTMACNVFVLFTAGRIGETLKRFWPLYLSTLPGIVAGIALLTFVNKTLATHILGGVLILYVLQALLKPSFYLQPQVASAVQVPVGVLNGLFTGLTGCQTMPLIPYMLSLKLEANFLVQAINLAVITASFFLGVALWMANIMSMQQLALSALACIPAIAGTQIGTWARKYIPAQHFRMLVLIVLMLTAVSLLIKA